MQGHLMRLNALGDRLVEVGNLDREEFDFASSPPVGGIDDSLSGETQDITELSAEMSRISALLDDREDKLAAMEQLLKIGISVLTLPDHDWELLHQGADEYRRQLAESDYIPGALYEEMQRLIDEFRNAN